MIVQTWYRYLYFQAVKTYGKLKEAMEDDNPEYDHSSSDEDEDDSEPNYTSSDEE